MSKFDELTVEAQSEHGQDIREYVRNNLMVKDPSIEIEILRKSSHVFLWVKQVVKMLNKASVDGRVRVMKQILDNVPDDLDDLYCELLTKGRNPEELRESVYMLQWVLFAKKYLRPEELYFAVLSGTDPDNLGSWDQQKEQSSSIQRYITSTSRGLIEVVHIKSDAESDTEPVVDSADFTVGKSTALKVQLIHESVKDFLFSVKGLQLLDSSLNQRLVGDSHGRLASCCYAYIMMTSLESMEKERANEEGVKKWIRYDVKQSYPFLWYSVSYILEHIEDAEMGGISQLELLKKLQPGSKGIRRLRYCNQILDLGFWTNGSEVLHVAVQKGLYQILRKSLEKIKVKADVVGGYWGTALQDAAARGHEKIVQLLLHHRANVNTVSVYHGTALQAAAARGNEQLVQLFLDHGANVNTVSGHFGTALQAATSGGYEKIVQLLLEHGANINTVNGCYSTALQAVARGGHEKIVQLLLDYGADIKTIHGEYGTALQAAATEGHEKIVQLCLEHGVNTNTVSGVYGTALNAAAVEGLEEIVQLLLDHGADVNITGGNSCTVLHVAVLCYSEPIARILLKHGADVNARDGSWGTALHTARRKKYNQASIDLLWGPALHFARSKGYPNQAIVNLLLEYGAEDHPPIGESSELETDSAVAVSAEPEAKSD